MPTDDLTDEIAALNAIYSPSCLSPSGEAGIYLLSVPTPLRIRVPNDYPASKPQILGGGNNSALASATLDTVFRPGEVCFYDLVEGLREALEDASPPSPPPPPPDPPQPAPPLSPPDGDLSPTGAADDWTVAPPLIEKKSVFTARAIRVTSASEAQTLIQRLLSSDKRIARATHNISAFRILREGGVVVQDNDDDGETAAGSRLAHLLQLMDVRDVCVVVSRWYGGIKLGPDRFRLINTAAREALVLGGFVKEEEKGKKGKGKGKR